MKNIGRQMSILMGVTLSFFLSLVGNLTSGHFAFPAWIVSFLVSALISLVIGFFVPMKQVTDNLHRRRGLKEGAVSTRLIDAVVSDLIYTPVITLVMIFLAWRSATSHGAKIPFLPMFLKGLLLSLVVGYVLILIFTPLYMNFLRKRAGIGGPGKRP